MFSSTSIRSSGSSSRRRSRTGSIAERRILALRPAEVRADADRRGAALEQQLERRQRRADARVVGDGAVLERDVQVGADEDDLPRDVGVTDRARQPHSAVWRTWKSSSRLPAGSRR